MLSGFAPLLISVRWRAERLVPPGFEDHAATGPPDVAQLPARHRAVSIFILIYVLYTLICNLIHYSIIYLIFRVIIFVKNEPRNMDKNKKLLQSKMFSCLNLY